MPKPQNAIFDQSNRFHHVLEYTVAEGDLGPLKAALRTPPAPGTSVTLAFGPALWRRLAPDCVPDGLRDFTPLDGPDAHAPATQRDLLVWIQGQARDAVLDGVMALDGALAPVAGRALDIPGFVYHDSRDLTGFVDGSANAEGDARLEQGLIGPGKSGAAGAYVLSQKWVHDLDAFNALPVAEQEKVIGRTKADSIELEGDDQPANSHVSRTDVKRDGEGMKMFRRSFPYGTAREKGLYFLAFTSDIRHFEVVLDSMYNVGGTGVTDRLTGFSKAITGSYWFAPSQDDLDSALR